MTKKLLLVFALCGVSLTYAKTYSLTLHQPSTIAGKELKAGSYKLELKEQTVVIRRGQEASEAPVKIEKESANAASTTVRYESAAGKNQIREIRLGGTNMKLVFND